jgi:endonuclease/exonuclease/phosphatase family metal-dependent hydrolase
MKRISVFTAAVLLLLVAVALSVAPASSGQGQKSKVKKKARPVAGQYIVTLQEWAAQPRGENSFAANVAADIASQHKGRVKHVYKHALLGFAVELTPEAAEAIVRALGRRYPYREFRADPNLSGTCLLSRYPLRDVELFQLAEEGVWNQRAIFEAPSGPVTVFNVHVPVPRPEWCERPVGPLRLPFRFNVERRRIAVRRLMELADAVEGPCLVLGDFNMTERSRDYRLVRARLGDAYRAVGSGFGHTFPVVGSFPASLPAPWPVLRLDYIWHSADFRPLTAHLGRPGGSDHHPVIVRLAPMSSPVVTGK